MKEQQPTLLSPANLGEDISALHAELHRERDRYLRSLADFSNYRRRVEREAARNASEGARTVIIPLLGVLDDLENALAWAGDNEHSVTEGVRLIHQKCLALLASHGVYPFDSVGVPFDVNRHEAISLAAADGHVPGTVIDELRRGYLWNTELLRAAQVRVAE